MEYLKGYTKNTLKGISFSAYLNMCEALGNEYIDYNTTKYAYPMIQHQKTGEYALQVNDKSYLDVEYQAKLVDESVMDTDGWFEQIEAG